MCGSVVIFFVVVALLIPSFISFQCLSLIWLQCGNSLAGEKRSHEVFNFFFPPSFSSLFSLLNSIGCCRCVVGGFDQQVVVQGLFVGVDGCLW